MGDWKIENVFSIQLQSKEQVPNLFIQSETSAITHEYSESNRVSKYVMLRTMRSSTAVKRKNLTPLPVFAALTFPRV